MGHAVDEVRGGLLHLFRRVGRHGEGPAVERDRRMLHAAVCLLRAGHQRGRLIRRPLEALAAHRELGQVDPPDGHDVRAGLPPRDRLADRHGGLPWRAGLHDLLEHLKRFRGTALVDLRVHVAVEIGHAVAARDIDPEPPREVRRVHDDRGAVDVLRAVLVGEEPRRIAVLLPRGGNGQLTLEPLRELLLVVSIGEIARPIVQIMNVAIDHQAVGLAAPLRIELAVAGHDPVEVLLGAAEVREILVERLEQPEFREQAEVQTRHAEPVETRIVWPAAAARSSPWSHRHRRARGSSG